MSPILLIAANTLRQTIRQRLYFNIAVFGVGMVLLAMVVGQITFGYPDRVVRSLGLTGVTIAVDLLALLTSVSLIHEEIDRKTLFVVLTRPLSRWQYVVGRYLGLLVAVTLAMTGFGAVFFLVLMAVGGTPTAIDLWALAAAIPEAAILGAFGMVLSAFSTPTLSAGIGLGFWLAAATTDDLMNLTAKSEAPARLVATAAYYALPSLARFNFRELAVYGGAVSLPDVLGTLGYAGLYMAGLVALASVILSRREML
jgi:Cu-processing system permease protein